MASARPAVKTTEETVAEQHKDDNRRPPQDKTHESRAPERKTPVRFDDFASI